jgi:hypothetical protein
VVETNVIHIDVAYESFDNFWQSNTVPVGPSGKATAELTPQDRQRLKVRLREQLPSSPDGRIAYQSSANAVKGTVPAAEHSSQLLQPRQYARAAVIGPHRVHPPSGRRLHPDR